MMITKKFPSPQSFFVFHHCASMPLCSKIHVRKRSWGWIEIHFNISWSNCTSVLGTFHALRIKGTIMIYIQRSIGQSCFEKKKIIRKKERNKSHLGRYSFKLNLENYRLDRKCYRDWNNVLVIKREINSSYFAVTPQLQIRLSLCRDPNMYRLYNNSTYKIKRYLVKYECKTRNIKMGIYKKI